MCPVEHLFNSHHLCDSAWCVKKRGKDIIKDTEISNFDKVLESKELGNKVIINQAREETFNQNSKGYYRCKTVDKEMYETLKNEIEKYVTDEKLQECCHEYDTNVNESIYNICAKYASKENISANL